VLERFGPASCGGQPLYDQSMGVLAQIIDRQRTMGRFERFIWVIRRMGRYAFYFAPPRLVR
jgi:hypothetical protein